MVQVISLSVTPKYLSTSDITSSQKISEANLGGREERLTTNPAMLLLAVFLSLLVNILAGPVNSSDHNTASHSHCPSEHSNLTNLWRVNTSPPSYLFGTIHVPYTLVWEEISNNSKTAFLLADRVYLELDITKTREETKGRIKILFKNFFVLLLCTSPPGQ